MKNLLFILLTIFIVCSFKSIEKYQIKDDLEVVTNQGLDKISYTKAQELIDNFNNNSPFPNQINGFCIPKSFFKDIPNDNDDEGVEFIFGATNNSITLIMKPVRFNNGELTFDNTKVWSSAIKNSNSIEELINGVFFVKKKDNINLLENAKNKYQTNIDSLSNKMLSFFVGKKLLHRIVYPDNESPRKGIKIFLAKFNASSKSIGAIFQADDNENSPYILKNSVDFQIYSCIYEHFQTRSFSDDNEISTIKPCPKYCGN